MQYTYDARGRTIEIDDDQHGPSGGVTTMAYDVDGRMTQMATPEGTLNYEYDDLGRKTATFTDNTRTEYTYDELNRLETVTVAERANVVLTTPETTTYVYNVVGNMDATQHSNGVTTDYVYDDLNRLDDIYHFIDTDGDHQYEAGTETLISSFDYTVNATGQRTEAIEKFDTTGDGNIDTTHTFTWVYDNLDRLISEHLDSTSLDNYTTTYAFDLSSNRVEMTTDNADDTKDATTTYAYDANDRLLTEVTDFVAASQTDTNTVYAYGTNAASDGSFGGDHTIQTGKTIREGSTTPGSGTVTESNTFTYDVMGRLSQQVTTIGGGGGTTTTTTYGYNASGLRVSETINDGTTTTTKTYLFDPSNPTGYAQVLEEYVDGVLSKTFTLGHDVLTQHDATNGALTFMYDGHGSVRALLTTLAALADNAGTLQLFTFDAYGNAVGFTATSALTNLLYSGEWTGQTGQQYLRARFYDSSSGRFNRVDPYSGNLQDPLSLNKYLYTHGNPINNIDPSGLVSLNQTLAAIGIGAIVVGTTLAGIGHFTGNPKLRDIGVFTAIAGLNLVGASTVWAFAAAGKGAEAAVLALILVAGDIYAFKASNDLSGQVNKLNARKFMQNIIAELSASSANQNGSVLPKNGVMIFRNSDSPLNLHNRNIESSMISGQSSATFHPGNVVLAYEAKISGNGVLEFNIKRHTINSQGALGSPEFEDRFTQNDVFGLFDTSSDETVFFDFRN